MSFSPSEKKIAIEPLTANTYSSKFKTVALMLHGFEGVEKQLTVNGRSISPKATSIDLYNSIKPNDPLWFDSRKMEQQVLLIDNLKANENTEIGW
jgi:hypothetical protein